MWPEIEVGDGISCCSTELSYDGRTVDGTRTRDPHVNSEVTVSCAPGTHLTFLLPEIKIVHGS